MRKLIASEWVTLDGVFEADTMEDWFVPYETEARGAAIREAVDAAGAFLMGRVTYQELSTTGRRRRTTRMASPTG